MKVKDCNLIKALYCDKATSIRDVARILRDNKQRRIIIVDKKKPAGIISTTDINNKIVAEGKDPSKTKAKEIMTSPIYMTCDINDDLTAIFHKMLKHQSYFCPVTKSGNLYAVLTYGELVRKAREGLHASQN